MKHKLLCKHCEFPSWIFPTVDHFEPYFVIPINNSSRCFIVSNIQGNLDNVFTLFLIQKSRLKNHHHDMSLRIWRLCVRRAASVAKERYLLPLPPGRSRNNGRLHLGVTATATCRSADLTVQYKITSYRLTVTTETVQSALSASIVIQAF